MNCFFLSMVVAECAAFHNDKHVVKMILELAQMLYTAHTVNNVKKVKWRNAAPGDGGYRMTHRRHPTAIWVRTAPANYRFMAELAKALCLEYTYRYGRTHKTEMHIDWLLENSPEFPPPKGHDQPNPDAKRPAPIKPVYFSKSPRLPGMTAIPLAMPEDCYQANAVLAYQAYYIRHKHAISKWTKRDTPKWFTTGYAKFIKTAPIDSKTAEQGPTGQADSSGVSGKKTPARSGRKRKAAEQNDDPPAKKAKKPVKVTSVKTTPVKTERATPRAIKAGKASPRSVKTEKPVKSEKLGSRTIKTERVDDYQSIDAASSSVVIAKGRRAAVGTKKRTSRGTPVKTERGAPRATKTGKAPPRTVKTEKPVKSEKGDSRAIKTESLDGHQSMDAASSSEVIAKGRRAAVGAKKRSSPATDSPFPKKSMPSIKIEPAEYPVGVTTRHAWKMTRPTTRVPGTNAGSAKTTARPKRS